MKKEQVGRCWGVRGKLDTEEKVKGWVKREELKTEFIRFGEQVKREQVNEHLSGARTICETEEKGCAKKGIK